MSATTPEQDRCWPPLLGQVLDGRDLTAADTTWVMDQVMRGRATDAQIAGFLVALRAKGETVGELEGLVHGMLAHAVHIDVPGRTVDVVGTGGDGAHTVNISTMSAIVAAGAGARVVKHGNRAASSASGSADVLEALGVTLRLPPERIAAVVDEAGITFCFAPDFHPAMRHAAGPRKQLGIPTVFNALGPLTNPAAPTAQAVGVADARLLPLIAGALSRAGGRGLVFRGDDGLDELTVTTTSTVLTVDDGDIRRERFDPRDVGIALAPLEALRGADAAYNATVARRVLDGERGPVRDAVLLSAGAALVAGEPTGGRTVTERLGWAVEAAGRAIDSGAAADTLERWVRATAAPHPPAVEAPVTRVATAA
ncbi:anthranilate phosphoribosyltransferase (plasmid) [Streptomyces sp. NBC_01591]|uniref:anthranilate phosphoribosyltransferase n=1 Tax=Streptomyces sp. NBC_01591 TaxID=2975888 RepID=UPI002DD83F5D|nr:anthranilate phosphoribosyltransferase [Streptomyces sp. NBC_01591]WSD73941.1 anthranilate phosphoribosyltransferase [Streptomyces sp. NBC_01591]